MRGSIVFKAGNLARRLHAISTGRAHSPDHRALIFRRVDSLCGIIAAAACMLVMVSVPAYAQTAPKAQSRPAQAQDVQAQNNPAQGAPADPGQRIEIQTFDNWTVTCRHPSAPGSKKACSALLQITQEGQGGQRTAVFSWVIGIDPAAKLTSVFMTPTGVSVQRGVDVQIGKSPVRKSAFSICEPQHCEAVLPLDNAAMQAIRATDQIIVTVTGSRGQQVNFTIFTKGFERMIAQLTS